MEGTPFYKMEGTPLSLCPFYKGTQNIQKGDLTKRDNDDQLMMVTHAGGSFGRLHLELIVIGNGGSSEKSTPKLGWGLVLVLVLVLVLGNRESSGKSTPKLARVLAVQSI